MKLSELISIFREKNNMSLEQLGNAVGVSKSTVSRWESGLIRKISTEKIDKLSEVFGIDVEDYLKHYFFKPILGKVEAGYNRIISEEILGYEQVSKHEYDIGDFFLKVSGDSMSGSRIYNGDLIYVKQTDSIESGDIAVVLIENDEVTVKRVIKKEGLLILEASNPEYPNRYYSLDEVETLGIKFIGKVLKVNVSF